MWKLENLQPFRKKLRSFLLQYTSYSVEGGIYVYLVEYNAVFAQLDAFRKISFFYNERSTWWSFELHEFIEGNFLSLF
jgi:hypothetical protein